MNKYEITFLMNQLCEDGSEAFPAAEIDADDYTSGDIWTMFYVNSNDVIYRCKTDVVLSIEKLELPFQMKKMMAEDEPGL